MSDFLAEGSPLRTWSGRLFRRTRWLLLLVITILGGTSTLLAIPDTSARIRSQIPLIRCWYPVPMDSARFNLIFAPLVTVTQRGRTSVDANGRTLSHLLYTQMLESVGAQELGVPVEVRAPDRACPIRGRDSESRARAAAEMARETGASLILFGALQEEGTLARLYPEFYVSAGSAEVQSEIAQIAGPYVLGSPIPVRLPVEAQEYVGLEDHAAIVRVRALSLIALGLRAAAGGQHDVALEFFKRAEELPGWLESEGKENVYLLLGNAASELAFEESDTSLLDDAVGYFDHALRIAPTFARAMVGRAGVLYQQGLGDFAALSCANLNDALLDQARTEYMSALALQAPPEAEIPVKVHYGLGNIALVRAYCTDPVHLETAREEYGEVVRIHDAAPVLNRSLVGHALARLALIAADHDQDSGSAVQLYDRAVALVSERWQAEYLLRAGDLVRDSRDAQVARTYYEKARDAATLAGASRLVEEAGRRLADSP